MIDLVNGGREEFRRNFKNIVIYGHSLGQADYSYFYSILDTIELGKYNKYASRLAIAFTDYSLDEEVNKKNRIILAESVIKLINSFEKWKNPNSSRYGLLEMLETSDRIGYIPIDTSVLKKIK